MPRTRMDALGIWKEKTGDKSGEARELKRPLTDAEDQLIWGPVPESLEKLVLRSDWQGGGVFGAGDLEAQPRISPLVRSAAGRVLPEVEQALRRHPSHWMTWHLWLRLAGLAGGHPLLAFLATVTPLPTDHEPFPPDNVVDAYVKDAKTRGDWQGIRDFMLPQWDQTRDREFFFFSNDGEDASFSSEHTQWEHSVEPLVEALLRLRDPGAADKVVIEAMAMLHSKGIATWAAQVASRCGYGDYAIRWAALTPSKGK